MAAEPEERDYYADFYKFIDENLSATPYNGRREIERLHRKLQAEDLDLWIGWLEQESGRLFSVVIQDRQYQQRVRAKMQKEMDAWVANGNGFQKTVFEQMFRIDAKGTWKRLGEMNHDELLFVADQRETTGKMLLREGAMYRDLASDLGPDQLVEQVLTPVRWRQLVQDHGLAR